MTRRQPITTSSACRLLWLTLSLGTAVCTHAGTFSSSTTAPAVNGADIANLGTQTGSDKWFFQTSDESNPSDAAKGQTFITPGSTVKLKALTYKIGSGNMKAAQTTYKVRVGTVSGTTFTQIASETCLQTVSTATGAYMTWTLGTPLTLSPNTTYAIDVGMDSAVSWTTGIPYLSYTANISNARIGSYYDSGDLGVGDNTLDFTTARDRVFHLDLEDPQNPTPDDGSTVPAGNVVLGWTNLPPTTGTNVWVDVWFGTNPTALTKVVSAALNLTTHTVSAPIGDTYYWRIDSYLNGVSTGTPAAGTRFGFIVTDTDADGLPDDFELLHTTPASTTALNPGDDLDSDGLTNLQEYQIGTLPRDSDTDNDTLLDGPERSGVGSRPATDPKKADTDGDSINDGAESNTGIWVSSTNRGTNPTKTDTDGDGLSDGVETNTGTYVSETNTGTNPLLRDTDGDNAEDWYEVAAAYTNPTLSSSKPNIPYPLPDPDSSSGTGTKPVKVFILSGQSNMVGFGRVAGTENDTLQSLTQTEKKFPNLITSTNAWTVRNDVLYRGVISALGDAPLAPGFGESSASFGPELGFGHAIGYIHDEPVLIIKTSIGNRALGWDFLPPGSVRYNYGSTTYPAYGEYDDFPVGGTPPVTGAWYAGKQYDDSFLDEEDMGPKAWASGIAYISGCYVKNAGKTYVSKSAHTSAAASAPGVGASWTTYWTLYSVFNTVDILDNFATEYPQWASRGFEIAGIGWFQGWNDGQSTTTAWATRYEQNLVRLIKQLRLYYANRYPVQAKPDTPFVTVTCGFDGAAAAGNRLTVVNAQLAVGDPVKYPEFAGNVKSMEGRGYWRTSGPNTAQNYHYYHNAETYMLVGDAMGRGMIDLLGASNPQPIVWSQAAGGAQNWTTGANWILGSAPSPLADDTLDFSTVNIAANTSLSLGANRTGGLWKFGDTAGAETWTVNSGNTITLAGTTPTIEVVNNSAQLDCLVAGTAGLAKTGAGTLILSASNTYTGVTRISAGTLQAAILANGSSNSSIGASSNAATNLILNGGTLEYSGAAVSTNRLFSLQTSSSIDASGTGAVNFTATGSMGFNSNTAAKTLTLDGTNTGANTLAAIIGDNTGATSLIKSGTGTWLLSGANTYTGATTINGGALRLANAAAVSGSSLVAIGGNRLEIATNTAFSGPAITSQLGTIVSDRATAGAGLTHVLGDAVIGNGLSNFTAGSNVTSGIAAIQLGNITNNNGSTATPGLNPTTANLIITGKVTLGTSNTGTANLTLDGTGSVNSIAGIIENGTRASGNVIKSDTSTWTLSGLSATAASNYNGSTTIDNGTLRFTTTNPSLTGGLTFGSASGGITTGTLDLSAASATFGGAFLVRTDSATANAISIGSGRTLQLSGSVTVGYNSAANSTTKLNVTGLGTCSIGTIGTPTNANVQIGNGATTSISNSATMDLSGLSTFYSNLGTGTFRIGSPTNSGGVSAGGSTVILAANSTLQADKLLLASPDASSSTQSLKLGSGTNVLNVNTIHITGTGDLFSNTNGRSTGSLTFNGATGSLTLRGLAGGTSRSDLNAGWSNMNTANAPTGTFNTTGHTADLRIGTMTLGRRTTNSTSGMVSGLFNFDQGTLDSDNLIVALAEAGGGSSGTVSLGGGSSTFNNITHPIRLGENITGGGAATGTLNVSGLAIVNVAASGGTSIRLGHATTAGGTATGNLNLTGGTLTVAGDIIRGATVGTSNATLSLGGGILDMTGKNINSLTSITYSDGTLKNLGTLNTGMTLAGTGSRVFDQGSGISGSIQGAIAGAGLGLTKQGVGSLTLTGPNTYSGDTTVTVGTLTLADNAQLMFLIGSTSGTNNRITGTGTVILNGDFNIDTTLTDASALTSGSWTLVNASTLTETYGSSFTITGAGWSEAANVWTKTAGSKKYTFTEATGILALSSAASYASWIDGFFPGESNPSIIGAAADPDQDGIENGVELLIGGNPRLGMDAALLPTIARVNADPEGDTTFADYLLFTYRRSDLSVVGGVAASCEMAINLAAPWTPAAGAPGVVILVDDNFAFTPPAAADTDRVRVYVPHGSNPVLFGRLKVLVP